MKEKNMENGDVIIREESDRNNLTKWWRTRTKNEKKCTCCFLGTLLVLAVGLGVYFGFFSRRPMVCRTSECYEAASDIQSFVDETQKPCDDFYRFSCGRFLQNNSFDELYTKQSVKLLMEEEIQGEINKMLEEEIDPNDIVPFNLAKSFYRACMNEQAIEKEGVKKFYHLFKQMGGWPIVEGENFDYEHFSWTRAVRNLRASGVDFHFFFNVSVDVDRERPERYILGIHDKYYSPSEISPNSKVAFLDYMVDVVSQFDVKVENLRKELNDVLTFLLALGKISDESNKTNRTNLYNLHSLTDLRTEYPSIPWIELLQGILRNSAHLRIDDVINVSEPVYLKKLEIHLSRTSNRVLANFMGWHVVQSLINYLPSRILDRAYEYLRKVNGYFYRKPRWSVCVEATRHRLGAAINVGYVSRYFDDGLKRNATELIQSIKQQFRKNLLMANWLDEETKRRIMKTFMASTIKIYSDSDLLGLIQESSVYNNVRIEDNKLLKAVLDLDLINWDLHYSLLRQPVRDDWIRSETFISGLKVVYAKAENALKFPLGLLRGIYFNQNRPDYLNYGLLGSILGHQISHIYVDAEGAHVAESKAAQERLLNWWSPISVQKYFEKLECLSHQYDKFELSGTDKIRTNSLKTRDEDIADLAGLKVAYDAYIEKEWRYGSDAILPGLKYSPRQLFWISSALQFCSKYPVQYLKDKYSGNRYHHSPGEFRVNGPLQNLEEFSRDFECAHGSYMNPKIKCTIW